MKKILFQSPAGGVLNGADMATKWQMKYLVDQGFEVGYIYSDQRAMTSNFEGFLAEYKIQSFRIEYNWWMNQELTISDFQCITEIVEIINENNYDVAITATANIPHLAFAAALTKIKHIWLIHEYPKGEFSYTKAKYDFISQFSTKILTANQDLSKQVGKLIGDEKKVGYFYPFSDANNQVIEKSSLPPRIINVNAFTNRKNNLELIAIFEKLQSDYPDLELVFTGKFEGEYAFECEQYILSHKIKNVSFLNDFDKNWANVRENDIFVNPSKMETFGLTLVEALKFGVVTISSTNQTGEEMVKLGYLDTDLIYKTGEIDTAVAKISNMLSNFQEYKVRFKQLSKRVVEEQRLEVITESLKKTIEGKENNPSESIAHLKAMFVTSGNALVDRLAIIKNQEMTLDERLSIINDQERTLEERMSIIQEQKAILEERMSIIREKTVALEQHLTTIEDQKVILAQRLMVIDEQESLINRLKNSMIGKIFLRGKL
ncbi:glycosyltransferase [Lactococcus piscium]|uniref:glycosyltransferase family 4 protein n=1 Tax=Pseudolactococcus carnosus TaxID=2749961 RepID=UPI001FB9EC54|nr:glycosyltransferase family 4 protein [Lactococcus carnosus]MCJ1996244.1 glycosyltransferase [Lactococcus carnosus]